MGFLTTNQSTLGVGKGLFAKVPLNAGDRLEIIGVLIPRDFESDRCTSYADERKFRVGDALRTFVFLLSFWERKSNRRPQVRHGS